MNTGVALGPLFRHSVGFDQFDDLMDAALRTDERGGYPPYDIVREGEDRYRIDLAVAGFSQEDLDVSVKENQLSISGDARAGQHDEDSEETWLHRGIARRPFQRTFRLAEHVQVEGASLRDGLLRVRLKRVIPESSRPKTVEIETDNSDGESRVGRDLEHEQREQH